MNTHLEAPTKGKETLATGVARDIRERIGNRELALGERLPTVLALAKQYGVSHITIRAAVRELSETGFVQSRRGSGIFVAEGPNFVRNSGRSAPKPISARDFPAAVFPAWLETGEHAPKPEIHSAIAQTVLGVIAFVDDYGISHGNLATLPMRDMVCVMEREFTALGGKRVEYLSILGDEGHWFEPRQAVEQLVADGAGAIALINVFDTSEYHLTALEACNEAGIPLVFVSGQGSFVPTSHVYCDQKHAGYIVTRHLIAQGARRITFIAPFSAQWLDDRIIGARTAVVQSRATGAGLEVFPAKRSTGTSLPRPEWAGHIAELLNERGVGDAIIAPNDEFALELLTQAKARGLEPGRDFLIAGFDNLAEARTGGLTSVHPPYSEMAKEATRILVKAIETGDFNQEARLHPVLVPRRSTRALPVFKEGTL